VDPRALAATGWSANEYWLFSNWFYLDEGIFNLRSVSALRDFVRQEKPLPPSLEEGTVVALTAYRDPFAALAAALILALAWSRGRWALPLVLAAAGFVAGTFLMDTYWEFPLHVGLPFVAAAAMSLLAIPVPGAKAGSTVAVAVLAAAVVGLGIARLHRVVRENRNHGETYAQIVANFDALPPGSVLLLEGAVLRLDWSDPFHPPQSGQAMIRTGMGIYSPIFYENLGSLGLHSAGEVIPFLASSGRGYVVAHPEAIPHLVEFAREAYSRDIGAKLVAKLESGANIYRILPHAQTP
jgi:hypothetical protein